MRKFYVIGLGAIAASIFIIILIKSITSDKPAEEEKPTPLNACHLQEKPFKIEYLVENNIDQLQMGEDSADIELIAQQRLFKVHKIIVAAYSEYFEKVISTELDQNRELDNRLPQVEINDTNHEILAIVLNFIYNGTLPANHDIDYYSLLQTADRLQIQSLKCQIERYLQTKIGVETVAPLLVLAEEAHAKFLQIAASNFLMDHLESVRKTERWQSIARAHKSILTNAIDIHGKSPQNSVCQIKCQASNIRTPYIFNRLRRFFFTEQFADAEFHISHNGTDRIFNVNKALLIEQSDVFRNLFGSTNKAIHLSTNVSDVVMKEFLTYMYSGWTAQLFTMTEDLLYLSALYKMDGLKSACEDIIIDRLNVSNAAKLVEIADRAHSKRLSNTVLDFILKNKKEVVKTNEWTELKRTNADILTKIFSEKP